MFKDLSIQCILSCSTAVYHICQQKIPNGRQIRSLFIVLYFYLFLNTILPLSIAATILPATNLTKSREAVAEVPKEIEH